MLPLNLFHEQLQIQREKDLDPVRWTIVVGSLLVALIICWASGIYWKMGDLRAKDTEYQLKLKELTKKLADLGERTDLGKIQAQAQALHDRVEYRPLVATQLDTLQGIIPTNCQVRVFKMMRPVPIGDITITPPPVKNAKTQPPPIKKYFPQMDMVIEVNTQAKAKGDVLQIRDNQLEILHAEPRFRDWVKQVKIPDAAGGTNTWNDVNNDVNVDPDPKEGEMATGVFEFKMPMALKDPPKTL